MYFMPLNGTSKNIENGKFDIMDVLSQFLKKTHWTDEETEV